MEGQLTLQRTAHADLAPGPARPYARSVRRRRQRPGSWKKTRTDAIEQLDQCIAAVAEHRDRAAFRALFDHFAPRLNAFLLGQGADPGQAEDVVQETMVNVWRKAAQFDPARASAATWVYTIARNLRIDMIRKARRPEPDMNDPAMVPDAEPGADDQIARNQETDRLKAAVAALPEAQQEVLRLAFFEEKAHSEVAEVLGIPLGTVKSRIRLALKSIRSTFGDIA